MDGTELPRWANATVLYRELCFLRLLPASLASSYQPVWLGDLGMRFGSRGKDKEELSLRARVRSLSFGKELISTHQKAGTFGVIVLDSCGPVPGPTADTGQVWQRQEEEGQALMAGKIDG